MSANRSIRTYSECHRWHPAADYGDNVPVFLFQEVMKITVPVGDSHLIEYIGNWFTGSEELKADGKIIFQRHRVDELKKRKGAGTCRRDEFEINGNNPGDQPLKAVFEIDRPYFYANLRPYTYRVFVDGKLHHEETGF
jgi:hypothetical protein